MGHVCLIQLTATAPRPMANTFHIGAVVRKTHIELSQHRDGSSSASTLLKNGWTLHPECGSHPGIAANETNLILESGSPTAVPLAPRQ